MEIRALYGKTEYAMNEITGQLVKLTGGRAYNSVIPGVASSPEVLCTLLFDQEAIDENWSPLGAGEASRRIDSYERRAFAAAAATR